MSVNYKEKYLKYKKKYLNLSNNKKQQKGAGFNINSPKQYRQHRVNENNDATISREDELNEENDDCVLCLLKLNINPEDETLLLPVLSKTFPCSHIFHDFCLKGSLKVTKMCPICRTNITNIYNLNRATMTWDIQQHRRLPIPAHAPYRLLGYNEDDIRLSSFKEYVEQKYINQLITQEEMQEFQNIYHNMFTAFNDRRAERALLLDVEREQMAYDLNEYIRNLRYGFGGFEELEEALNIRQYDEEVDEQEEWEKYISYVNEINDQQMIAETAEIDEIAADQKNWRLFKLFAHISGSAIAISTIDEYEVRHH